MPPQMVARAALTYAIRAPAKLIFQRAEKICENRHIDLASRR